MNSTTLPPMPLPSRQQPTRSQPGVLLGRQQPSILHMPDGVASLDAAAECVELAERYGPKRDDAQKITLQAWMGEQADGQWAAAIAAHAMSRQNGKGDELEDRELYGLLIVGEHIVHTAHEVLTAKNAFERLEARFQAHRDLRMKVAKFRYANGEQGIELKGGAFIAYRSRTGAAGRGLDDLDLAVYDEAQHLQPEHLAASSPALAVSSNPQRILAGSAGLSTSVRWWEMRMDALLDIGGRFAYVEHGAEQVSLNKQGELVSVVPDPSLEQTWADGNPAYGTRIDYAFLASQRQLLGDPRFLREHCGVWDPLPVVATKARVISENDWAGAGDGQSRVKGKVVLGVDVAPNDASAAVGFVGQRADGSLHGEVVESAAGTGWLLARVRRALTGGQIGVVAVEAGGPVRSVIPELKALIEEFPGVEWLELPGGAYAGGCQSLVTMVEAKPPTFRHKGQAWLSTAVGAASKRKYADLWVWDRWGAVDVSPLVAVTVALRAWQQTKPVERRSAYEDEGLMTV